MSKWEIIKPVGGTNHVYNPQFFPSWTNGWDRIFGDEAFHIASTKGAWRGPQCLQIEALSGTTSLLATHNTFTCPKGMYVQVSFAHYCEYGLSTLIQLLNVDTSAVLYSSETPATPAWTEHGLLWYNGTGNPITMRLQLGCRNYGSLGYLYVDAVLLTLNSDAQLVTYFDGDMPGCMWMGQPHNSLSVRMPDARSGGVRCDLKDVYGFGVTDEIGLRVPPVTLYTHSYATQVGGEVIGRKVHESTFSLAGILKDRWGTGKPVSKLHRALIDELMPWSYVTNQGKTQPIRLIHKGEGYERYIDAYLEPSSMDNPIGIAEAFTRTERMSLEWLAPYPYWREVRENTKRLEYFGYPSVTQVLRRSRTSGLWGNPGVSYNFAGAGSVRAIIYNPVNGRFYVGGTFTDFNNHTGWNYLVWYDLQTGTWGCPDNNTLTGAVNGLDISSNGDVYVAGQAPLGYSNEFAIVHIAQSENGVLEDFDANPTGIGMVYDVAVIPGTSSAWLVGSFTDWGGLPDANYMVRYSGGTWSLPKGEKPPFTWGISTVEIDNNGLVYVYGYFSDLERWGLYTYDDTTGTWELLAYNPGDHFSPQNFMLCPDGRIFLSSYHTLYTYSGSVWTKIVDTEDGYILTMAQEPDGSILIGGEFDHLVLPDGERLDVDTSLVRYDGSVFTEIDFRRAGGSDVFAVGGIGIGPADPLVPSNYELLVGLSVGYSSTHTTHLVYGYVTCGAAAEVVNEGNAEALPRIVINAHNATHLARIYNMSTGQALDFDYQMAFREILTIDCRPDGIHLMSNYRGPVPTALVSGTETKFVLKPGKNRIITYVKMSPTSFIYPYIVWQNTYTGID